MKVVLVYPRYKYPLLAGAIEPLGVQYLAASLIASGHDVDIVDLTFERSLRKLRASLPGAGFVGVSFSSPLFGRAIEVLKEIKAYDERLAVIAGGPHPTCRHDDVLKAGFDYAAIGEGEELLVEFARNMSEGRPEDTPGISYMSGSETIVNAHAPISTDLDRVHFPARHFIDYKRYDSLGIISSRGCSFNCSYCQPILRKLFSDKVRERSIGNIVDEIALLDRYYPGKRIRFEDDTFTARDTGWFYAFRDELRKRGLKVRWQCNSRVDTIDIEKARIMKEAGCQQIGFGVESGSDRILEFYGKGITTSDIRKVFSQMRGLGIITHAFIMLGAPGETRNDLKATYDLVRDIRPDKLMTYNVTPLPGSYFYDYCRDKGIIKARDHYEFDNNANSYRGFIPIKLDGISGSDIEEFRRKIDLYILSRSIVNLKILRVLWKEPRRIIRQAASTIRRYMPVNPIGYK